MSNEAHINQMVSDHKRLIEYESSKYSRFVPLHVVQAEAYKIAHKAAKSFNPDAGAKFSTHLTNQLKKLSRISTQYGSTIRLPENKQFKLQRLNHTIAELKDKLEREPNAQELADATGLPIKEINFLLQNRRAEVNVSNLAYTPTFVDNENDDWLHFVYHDLSPTDKVIFEYKTGFGGKPQLTNEEIASKLNMSASTVNNRAKMIADKIGEGWK
jgi:DNA-directed RNA polymerase sigma subunit (sigma70/sigma32)